MAESVKIYVVVIVQFVIFHKCLSQLNILIFGGNGFIGSECVRQLLLQNHNILLINRGSNYYDYEATIKSKVKHIECDRYRSLENCVLLTNAIETYDFIIDFSAYHPAVLEDTFNYLKGKFVTYIYISTDSVYEVSMPSKTKFSTELDAVRYPPGLDQDEANNKDTYGHYKLQCEEALIDESKTTGINYIILRLSDVIGPRDTTYRWWTYQTLVQFYDILKKPLIIPDHLQSTSYTYVKDIAKIISKIIHESQDNKEVLNEIYNLGFPQAISLRQILDSMQQILNIPGVEYRYNKANYLFPSVFRGPVDVKKAIKILKWNVTPWMDAVNETVMFYKQALNKFPKEVDRMFEKLKFFLDFEEISLLAKKIKEIQNDDIWLQQPKDEL